jgi:hypothetical protein
MHQLAGKSSTPSWLTRAHCRRDEQQARFAVLDELYVELMTVKQANTEQRVNFGRINGDAACTAVPKDDGLIRVKDDGTAVSKHSLASLVEFEPQFFHQVERQGEETTEPSIDHGLNDRRLITLAAAQGEAYGCFETRVDPTGDHLAFKPLSS